MGLNLGKHSPHPDTPSPRRAVRCGLNRHQFLAPNGASTAVEAVATGMEFLEMFFFRVAHTESNVGYIFADPYLSKQSQTRLFGRVLHESIGCYGTSS